MFVTILYVPINHELQGNAVLDVTEKAVALGVAQMAPIVDKEFDLSSDDTCRQAILT